MDGSWSTWSGWSKCQNETTTCGRGEHSRTRNCSEPLPQHGGLQCLKGDGSRGITELVVEGCDMKPCPGRNYVLQCFLNSNPTKGVPLLLL